MPGLTTVRVPVAEMGRKAGPCLLPRLQGGPVTQATKSEVELVVRGPQRKAYLAAYGEADSQRHKVTDQ